MDEIFSSDGDEMTAGCSGESTCKDTEKKHTGQSHDYPVCFSNLKTFNKNMYSD